MKRFLFVVFLSVLILSSVNAAVVIYGFDEIKDLEVVEMKADSGRVKIPAYKFFDFRLSAFFPSRPLFCESRIEVTHIVPYMLNLISFELNSVYDDSRLKVYADIYPSDDSSGATFFNSGLTAEYMRHFEGLPVFFLARGSFNIEVRILDTVTNKVYGHTYSFSTELQSTKRPERLLICSENNPDFEPLSGTDIYLKAPGTIGEGVVWKYDPSVSDFSRSLQKAFPFGVDDDFTNMNAISWVYGDSKVLLSNAEPGHYVLVYHYYVSDPLFLLTNIVAATDVDDGNGDQVWIERFEVVD